MRGTVEKSRAQAAANLDTVVARLKKELRPDFLAKYEPPTEMQALRSPKRQTGIQVYPGIVFAAIVHGRQANKKPAAN